MGNDNSILCRASVAALAVALAACGSIPVDPIQPSPEQPTEAVPTEPAPIVADEPIELKEDAPLRYVVQRGDTLWSIANRFLRDAWQWPEVWTVNPRVRNPHLIYPGDELYLYFADGAPRIARAGDVPAETPVEQAAEVLPPGGEGALTPRVRVLPLEQAIYSIPLDAIRGFLRGPRLVDEDALDDAPYIVDFEEEHIIAGNDSVAYALDIEDRTITQYQVVRRGREYRDPDDNDVIGYEVMPVADSEVRAFGDPSTIWLRRSDMEARAGDFLLPVEQDPLALRFVPHAPAKAVDGKIVSVYNGVSQIGQYHIIAINRGTEHGMEPGHVLTIIQSGRRGKDPYSFFGSGVQLPDIKAGTAMVFKTAPRVSLALVMSATRAIHLYDKVEKPDLSN